jgi:hypothetical protein
MRPTKMSRTAGPELGTTSTEVGVLLVLAEAIPVF